MSKEMKLTTTPTSIGDFSIHIFTSAEDAESIAPSLGLEGFHEHDIEGQTMYMPGVDHDTYNAAVELTALADDSEELSDHGSGGGPAPCPEGQRRKDGECVPMEDDDDETESKNTMLARRITETEGELIFTVSDGADMNHFVDFLEEGVSMTGSQESRHIRSFIFDKPQFDFASARAWLLDFGFFESEISDIQEMTAENQISLMLEEGTSYVYLENIAHSTQTHTLQDVEIKGRQMLALKAVAITAGEWKGISFTEEVLHEAVALYENVRIVQNHRFNEPASVMGFGVEQKATPGGVEVTAVIFDQGSMDKIKDGSFHAVSSNFLLKVDDDLNVKSIKKVVELTLTGNPACEDAVILSSEDIKLNFQESVNLTQTENPPPSEEAIGVSMSNEDNTETEEQETSISLEDELQTLRAQLEVSKQQIADKDSNAQQLNDRVVVLEKERQVSLAKEFIVEFTQKGFVTPAMRDETLALYLHSDAKGRDLLRSLLAKNPVVPMGDIGEVSDEKPDTEFHLSDDALDEMQDKVLSDLARNQAKGQGHPLRGGREVEFRRD